MSALYPIHAIPGNPYHRLVSPAIRVGRATARRFLVRRHLLAPPRSLPAEPDSVKRVVERLGSLQFDPLEVTGRNHDLVLAARIDGYRRTWTDALLYEERWLYEAYNKGLSLLPTSELPWFRISWDRELDGHTNGAFQEHADLVEELLDRIRRDGPLASTDFEPRAAIDWYWRPTNPMRALLEALAEAGILGLVRRDGNRRVYDLSERLFPASLLAERPSPDEQRRHRVLSRIRAHGLLAARGGQAEIWSGTGRVGDRAEPLSALVEAGDIVTVAIEGIRGDRYMLGSEVGLLEGAGASVAAFEPAGTGVALLAPLDPLVWDRDLLRSLFDFDYVWEVYVPAARRRWGYYVLPLLFGDRLVGRIEPRAERTTRTLRIVDLWWEEGFDPLATDGFIHGLADALVAHRDFLDLDRVLLPRTARHRSLARALHDRLAPAPATRVAS